MEAYKFKSRGRFRCASNFYDPALTTFPRFQLWNVSTGERVIHYVSKNIFKSRKRHLVVEPEAEATLDLIIIAYTIIDKRKKDIESGVNEATAANAAANAEAVAAA